MAMCLTISNGQQRTWTDSHLILPTDSHPFSENTKINCCKSHVVIHTCYALHVTVNSNGGGGEEKRKKKEKKKPASEMWQNVLNEHM